MGSSPIPWRMREIVIQFVSAGACSDPPQLKIVMGPIGFGKSRIRHGSIEGSPVSEGYATADPGDIFRALRANGWPDSDATTQAVDAIGESIVASAIRDRRNIIIELIGDAIEPVRALCEQMKSIGYTVDMTFIGNSLERCLENNAARSEDNLSAYNTHGMIINWFAKFFEGSGDQPDGT